MEKGAYIPDLIPLKAQAMFGATPEIREAAKQAIERARRAAHAARSGEEGASQ